MFTTLPKTVVLPLVVMMAARVASALAPEHPPIHIPDPPPPDPKILEEEEERAAAVQTLGDEARTGVAMKASLAAAVTSLAIMGSTHVLGSMAMMSIFIVAQGISFGSEVSKNPEGPMLMMAMMAFVGVPLCALVPGLVVGLSLFFADGGWSASILAGLAATASIVVVLPMAVIGLHTALFSGFLVASLRARRGSPASGFPPTANAILVQYGFVLGSLLLVSVVGVVTATAGALVSAGAAAGGHVLEENLVSWLGPAAELAEVKTAGAEE